jgi:hypothetical protein
MQVFDYELQPGDYVVTNIRGIGPVRRREFTGETGENVNGPFGRFRYWEDGYRTEHEEIHPTDRLESWIKAGGKLVSADGVTIYDRWYANPKHFI